MNFFDKMLSFCKNKDLQNNKLLINFTHIHAKNYKINNYISVFVDNNEYVIEQQKRFYKNYYDFIFNVNDFLKWLSTMPKFDIIIGNPPYGQHGMGSLDLHLEIAEKLLNHYKNKMIFIMPDRIGHSTSEKFNKWRNKFNMISEITDEGNPFKGFASTNVGIFVFENHIVDKVKVYGIDINSLKDITPFNEYENSIMKNLYSDFGKKIYIDARSTTPLEKIKSKLKKYNFMVNNANGNMNGTWFSSVLINVPIMNIQETCDFLKSYNVARRAICSHDNKQYLINLKEAMKRSLLRFCLYKMQDDQFIAARNYRYIPDIDWSDDRTKTDVGILMLCGIKEKEAKEFSKYCDNYILNIDKT